MRSIILTKPEVIDLIDTPEPNPPAANEALVRVHRVGICGTDLHAYRGHQPFFTYPRILGHELGVEVLEVGPGVTNVAAGDRCSVEPYFNCGQCVACRAGKTNACVRLSVLGVHIDGGMRDRILVPAHKLHKSASLSYEQLALIETLGIGAHAVDRAQVRPGEWVLVIGAGPIGLGVMQFARLITPNVIVMDVQDNRLAFSRSNMGIAHTVRADQSPLEAIESLTQGDLPTAVFDATGNVASMNAAFQYVAHGGRLTFAGLVQANVSFADPHFHRREMTLLASRNALSADFPRIMQLVESGQIDTRPWITHRAGYADFAAAMPGWLRPETGVIKAMLNFKD